MSKGRGALCAAKTSPAPSRARSLPLPTGNGSCLKGTGVQASQIWCCLPELPLYCMCTHRHTDTHTVLTGAVALPRRGLVHPSPFSNPSFPCLFFTNYFCPALALMAAECKWFSAAKGLHSMDCQRATWTETTSPRGFGAAVKHQSTTETQPHCCQHHHPTAQISPDTVLKLLIKQVIKLLISASTILEKRKR